MRSSIAKVRSATLAGIGAASLVLSGGAAAFAQPGRATIFPVVDHHQHMMSPTNLANRKTPPPLPTISLPPDLDKLLRAREQVSGSREPNDVFTQDAQVLRILQGDWVQGQDILNFLGNVRKGIVYRPTSFGMSGSVGFVAGVIQFGQPAKDVLNFMMGIKKGSDNQWRIAAETASRIPPPEYSAPITAKNVIADIDEAGISRAVLLSVAYQWGSVTKTEPVEDEYGKVRAENDWTAQEANLFPQRLVAFCGVNPLKDYALAEVDRCSKLRGVKGMKLHFANSGVDVRKPEHVEKLRQFFQAVNSRGLAIVAHLHVSGDYGAEHSKIFLERILPAAPKVTVQIAHLAGSGPSFDGQQALSVFGDAFAARDPLVKNVYVDVTGVVPNAESGADLVKHMRRIGLDRILYGSDMHPNPRPNVAWPAWRKLPLSDAELRNMADNVAPYLR